MPKLIAANFKMNGSFSFIKEWFDAYDKEDASSNEVIVALPAPYINMSGNGNIKISAQNVSAKESGAYTSQISVSMIADNNVSYCIIGHSEAREYLNESNEDIKAKYDLLIENNVKPIVCIGESIETRESKETFDFITKQLEHFKNVEDEITFAYEPIWAIGTGKVARESDIAEMHDEIRGLLVKIMGGVPAQDITLLYGGSVNAENVLSIVDQDNVDGILVGGASVSMESFGNILQKLAGRRQ